MTRADSLTAAIREAQDLAGVAYKLANDKNKASGEVFHAVARARAALAELSALAEQLQRELTECESAYANRRRKDTADLVAAEAAVVLLQERERDWQIREADLVARLRRAVALCKDLDPTGVEARVLDVLADLREAEAASVSPAASEPSAEDETLVAMNDLTIRHGLAIKHLIAAGGTHHADFLNEPEVKALLERDRFATRAASEPSAVAEEGPCEGRYDKTARRLRCPRGCVDECASLAAKARASAVSGVDTPQPPEGTEDEALLADVRAETWRDLSAARVSRPEPSEPPVSDDVRADGEQRVLPRTNLTVYRARQKLAGWHFGQEGLTQLEREILYVAEALLRLLDALPVTDAGLERQLQDERDEWRARALLNDAEPPEAVKDTLREAHGMATYEQLVARADRLEAAMRADLAEHDDALTVGGSGDFYHARAALAGEPQREEQP